MHAQYYARECGFGRAFEAAVAEGLAEFSARLDNPPNGLWLALSGDEGSEEIVGSIAIDGEGLAPGIAHLRWFVMDDAVRGTGVGRQLLTRALAFCDEAQFSEVQLWTFDGLHAARYLYETNGFTLADEKQGDQWGVEIAEQRFLRHRAR